MKLSDINGRIYFIQNVQDGENISVDYLPSGMYFVRIKTKDDIIEKKIIKK